MSIKTKKLKQATRLGRKIDRLNKAAKFAKWLNDVSATLNEKAIDEIGECIVQQDELLKEISGMRYDFSDSRLNHHK